VTTPDPKQARLSALRAALSEKKLEALLLTDIDNIGYVTGFTGSAAYAVVTADKAVLITDSRYTLRAEEECPYFESAISTSSGGYLETLAGVFQDRLSISTLGFEASDLRVSQYKKLKAGLPALRWTPTDSIVEDLRLVKDTTEVAVIRKAIGIAERAYQSIRPVLRAGVMERDVAVELEYALRKGGADAVAFEVIVASGEQGARPHHRPNERVLQAGDFVTLDWGASVDGYNSDITRTVLIGPAEPTTEQQKVYATVLQAQRAAIAAIAPEKTGKEIDAVARDYIAARGYGEAFGHSLGHSLGRKVHDGPGLSTRSEKVILKPGMVMTVEPGIYLPGWGGIRIEEDVVVTETGCEVLTHLANELEVIG